MSLDQTEVAKLLPEVRTLVNKVVHNNMADSILFSAGTDTSIIAYEEVKYKTNHTALTLAFKEGSPKYTEYVKKMVAFLKLNQETHDFRYKDNIFRYPPFRFGANILNHQASSMFFQLPGTLRS